VDYVTEQVARALEKWDTDQRNLLEDSLPSQRSVLTWVIPKCNSYDSDYNDAGISTVI
jgi:hypothetical protein